MRKHKLLSTSAGTLKVDSKIYMQKAEVILSSLESEQDNENWLLKVSLDVLRNSMFTSASGSLCVIRRVSIEE